MMTKDRVNELREFVDTIGVDSQSGWKELEECLDEIERLHKERVSRESVSVAPPVAPVSKFGDYVDCPVCTNHIGVGRGIRHRPPVCAEGEAFANLNIILKETNTMVDTETNTQDGGTITMAEYQKFVEGVAIYPNVGTNLIYPVLGLGDEAGEVQGKVKKALRDEGGDISDERREELIKELGDIMWYIAATAMELGTNIGEVAKVNRDKLLSRKERGTLRGSGDNR